MTNAQNNMNNVKMTYKDYELSSNPEKIEIEAKADVNISKVYDGFDVAENVSVCPRVIRGSGYFYGDKAEEECTYLSHMVKDRTAGWLFCPGLYTLEAYFKEFTYELDATKSCASYSFVFVERCSDTRINRQVDYVEALNGENMFDIANRVGISVSRLMELNDYASPFMINAGERVVLR